MRKVDIVIKRQALFTFLSILATVNGLRSCQFQPGCEFGCCYESVRWNGFEDHFELQNYPVRGTRRRCFDLPSSGCSSTKCMNEFACISILPDKAPKSQNFIASDSGENTTTSNFTSIIEQIFPELKSIHFSELNSCPNIEDSPALLNRNLPTCNLQQRCTSGKWMSSTIWKELTNDFDLNVSHLPTTPKFDDNIKLAAFSFKRWDTRAHAITSVSFPMSSVTPVLPKTRYMLFDKAPLASPLTSVIHTPLTAYQSVQKLVNATDAGHSSSVDPLGPSMGPCCLGAKYDEENTYSINYSCKCIANTFEIIEAVVGIISAVGVLFGICVYIYNACMKKTTTTAVQGALNENVDMP